jgi:hypothetical protein
MKPMMVLGEAAPLGGSPAPHETGWSRDLGPIATMPCRHVIVSLFRTHMNDTLHPHKTYFGQPVYVNQPGIFVSLLYSSRRGNFGQRKLEMRELPFAANN